MTSPGEIVRKLFETTTADFVCSECGETREWCERSHDDEEICEICASLRTKVEGGE